MSAQEEEVGKVIQCYHCGNKTYMDRVAHHNYYEKGDDEYGTWYDCAWELYFCPVCKNVTLLMRDTFSEDIDIDGHPMTDEKILYPYISQIKSNMPPNIHNAFEAALKVRNIDGAICALSMRRTLEMMCKDKGEVNGNLYNKLKNISQSGIIPPILDEMAAVLRKLGNAAAHADETDFSENLVRDMIELTQVILDYVYNLPKRIAEIQGKISEKSDSVDVVDVEELD